jgi:hypothetical protein
VHAERVERRPSKNQTQEVQAGHLLAVHGKLLTENRIQAIHVRQAKTDQEAVLSNRISRLEKETAIRVEKENHLVTAEEIHLLLVVHGKLLTGNQIQAIHVHPVKTDQEAVLSNRINRLEKETAIRVEKENHSATAEEVHILQAVRGKLPIESLIQATLVRQGKTDQEAARSNQAISRLEKETAIQVEKENHSATVEEVHSLLTAHEKHPIENQIQAIHVHPAKTDQEAVLSNRINRLEKEMSVQAEKENHLATAETTQFPRNRPIENRTQAKTNQEASLSDQINRLEKETKVSTKEKMTVKAKVHWRQRHGSQL